MRDGRRHHHWFEAPVGFAGVALMFIGVAVLMAVVPYEQPVHGLGWMGLSIASVMAALATIGAALLWRSSRTFDRRRGWRLR